ncbi:MAG TPA: hydroxymethylbilane synthase [Bryobacteraceae bacterium]|jgi:hydroxymethylbilane synthase|nr:hydroxymethylbilane synthase [Bryobacteraceae bacterium]
MAAAGTAARTLTIGSRGSPLALWQARHVAARLDGLGVATRLEIIKTTGDHLQTASLMQAGGKGLFTKEIEEALLAGAIDLAVHSLKDLPTEMPPGLAIAAIPEREDPRDAMVGRRLDGLPQGARVGTSSGRRAAQLRVLRPDLNIASIRGNVDTRLRKVKEGQYDAIVLAAAGLRRLGLEDEIAEIFSPEQICPAPGQGALAIETREADPAFDICASLNHEPARQAVACERAVLAALGGGCQLPMGAFAEVLGDSLEAIAVVLSPDGLRHARARAAGARGAAEQLGRAIAEDLIAQGARSILAESK